MSDSDSVMFLFDNSDPAMQAAYQQARATFRYFWREIAWERHRIIPALNMASVKAMFNDGTKRTQDNLEAEHMWLNEIDFDGRLVSGVLINSPNWVTSVKEGDRVQVPISEISDWMYVISDEVYGAFTVNLLRSRMGPEERAEHDAAWGWNFGDPHVVRGLSETYSMDEILAPSLEETLADNPSLVTAKGHNGWTLLHQHASAGSMTVATLLLDHGADINALTDQDMTPLGLARTLGWDDMVALLRSRGAE